MPKTTRYPEMTLKNLADYTDEQIIEESFQRVLNQGAWGVESDSPVCRYRTSTGNCCAVGALIQNEDYRAEFDETFLLSEVLYELGGDSAVNRERLLLDIRQVHDHARNHAGTSMLEQLIDCVAWDDYQLLPTNRRLIVDTLSRMTGVEVQA